MRLMRSIAAFLRDESGQALAEEGILLVTLLGIGSVSGLWLVRAHPEMLKALDIAVRSYLFVLSLPFP
jgi:Flp pilus assembly pilin Flp